MLREQAGRSEKFIPYRDRKDQFATECTNDSKMLKGKCCTTLTQPLPEGEVFVPLKGNYTVDPKTLVLIGSRLETGA